VPKFMNQSIFNSLVYTLALADNVEELANSDTSKIKARLVADYKKSFPTDGFDVELVEALRILGSWMIETQPNSDDFCAWLNAFRQASIDWNPNGTRKTRSLFNGTFFTAPRTKPTSRVEQFTKDTMLYYVNINSGAIR
jgi:hypothetical protein